MSALLKRIYDWTMGLAGHRHAVRWLAIVSFAESSFFPIPPDVMLIPMILAQRARAWALAALCTCASVFGGIAGYGIGFLLFESAGRPIVELYGYADEFARFQDYYQVYGAWIVAVFALTFLPYKVVTIASGVAALEPISFIIASVLGRGFRFFAAAALLRYFGPQIRSFIEARLGLITTAFVALLVAGFLIIKFAV
jgi:membrane protein YqaA with SNARE-associated domain